MCVCVCIYVVTSFHPYFYFSRYGRSPMCGLLRPRTNECLKVNVIWMDTWGFLNRTNNITRSCFFFLFFIYVSFIHFFHLKESTTVTTDKQRTKRMQQKNIQKCGGQFAPNSVWLGPSNKTKYFFFLLSPKIKSLSSSSLWMYKF